MGGAYGSCRGEGAQWESGWCLTRPLMKPQDKGEGRESIYTVFFRKVSRIAKFRLYICTLYRVVFILCKYHTFMRYVSARSVLFQAAFLFLKGKFLALNYCHNIVLF